MSGRLSRRDLAAVLIGVAPALAQAPAASPEPARGDLEKALDDVRKNGDRLTTFTVDPSVEPAVVFKP